jgi:hypothetical protein
VIFTIGGGRLVVVVEVEVERGSVEVVGWGELVEVVDGMARVVLGYDVEVVRMGARLVVVDLAGLEELVLDELGVEDVVEAPGEVELEVCLVALDEQAARQRTTTTEALTAAPARQKNRGIANPT